MRFLLAMTVAFGATISHAQEYTVPTPDDIRNHDHGRGSWEACQPNNKHCELYQEDFETMEACQIMMQRHGADWLSHRNNFVKDQDYFEFRGPYRCTPASQTDV